MLKRTDNSDTTTSETKLRKKSPDELLQRSKKLRTGELEKSLLNSPPFPERPNELDAGRLQHQKMEVVGQLTSGIVHDFKNLLTIISGNLEMLAHDRAKTRSPHDQRTLVAEAVRVTDLMAELAGNLLAFARQEKIDGALTDIGELANTTGRLLTRILGNGICLQIKAEPGLLAHINAAQFQTALINLALNARDAMPEGGCVAVHVADALVDAEQAHEMRVKPGRYVTVSVSDSGRGMACESLGRAFELFYTTKPAGTGLGLLAVQEFAANVGGIARIQSKLGQGTCAELWIPLDESAAAVKSKTSPSLAP
jgi:signal transduction histidine kinase